MGYEAYQISAILIIKRKSNLLWELKCNLIMPEWINGYYMGNSNKILIKISLHKKIIKGKDGASEVAIRAVARTLIGGGGLFIYSCSARLVSFQIDKFEVDFKRN